MVPSLAGLAPFQFAFVVRDLDRFVGEFDRPLLAGPWRGWVFGPQGHGREYRGTPAEWTLRLVLNSRSPQFEVVQPLDGPSVHADWLEERGEGFHHAGYVVRSLEQTTAEMEAAGHRVIAHPLLRSRPRRGRSLLRHRRQTGLPGRSSRAARSDADAGLHDLTRARSTAGGGQAAVGGSSRTPLSGEPANAECRGAQTPPASS